jgi:uncharacterized protein (TIGR00106 family)
MALMQITIIPMGTATPSVGEYVADVQELLQRNGCEYELNDMGTVIFGDSAELLKIAAEIHDQPFSRGARRVVTNILLDERRDRKQHIGDKKTAVVEILKTRNNEN